MNDRFADLETVVVASQPLPEMGINAQIWRSTRAVCLGKFPASPRKIVEQLTGRSVTLEELVRALCGEANGPAPG